MDGTAKKIHLLDPQLKDKDGNDGDYSILGFNIDVASNGFCLTIFYDDGSHVKEVHTEIDDVFKSIKGTF